MACPASIVLRLVSDSRSETDYQFCVFTMTLYPFREFPDMEAIVASSVSNNLAKALQASKQSLRAGTHDNDRNIFSSQIQFPDWPPQNSWPCWCLEDRLHFTLTTVTANMTAAGHLWLAIIGNE